MSRDIEVYWKKILLNFLTQRRRGAKSLFAIFSINSRINFGCIYQLIKYSSLRIRFRIKSSCWFVWFVVEKMNISDSSFASWRLCVK
jgi:hypothetical protein